MSARPHYSFKRLERDDELRDRIRAEMRKQGIYDDPWGEVSHASGERLDYLANLYKTPRHILEDVA